MCHWHVCNLITIRRLSLRTYVPSERRLGARAGKSDGPPAVTTRGRPRSHSARDCSRLRYRLSATSTTQLRHVQALCHSSSALYTPNCVRSVPFLWQYVRASAAATAAATFGIAMACLRGRECVRYSFVKHAIANGFAAPCSNYLCPDTLKCVTAPADCPCPSVEDVKCVVEDKETGEGTVICTRGGTDCTQAERLIRKFSS